MHIGDVFQSLFERSVDSVWLLNPHEGVFVDCNEVAVRIIGAQSKQQSLRMRPDELSPPFQPDGAKSAEKSAETIRTIQEKKTYLFEWIIGHGRREPASVCFW